MVVGNSTVLICEPRRDLNSWLRLNRFSAICSLGSSACTEALLVGINTTSLTGAAHKPARSCRRRLMCHKQAVWSLNSHPT